MDCYPVVEKWLAECRLNQYPDGRMANIAPPTSRPGYMTPMLCMSAGWGDAAILVPYALYKRTGDRKILADNYEMMQKWYGFLLGRAQQTTEEQQTGAYAKYTVLNGLDYGEWCEPGITPMQAMMNRAKAWVRRIWLIPGDFWRKLRRRWARQRTQRSTATRQKRR